MASLSILQQKMLTYLGPIGSNVFVRRSVRNAGIIERSSLRRLVAVLCVSLLLTTFSSPVWAGPIEDFKAAVAAEGRGDYATALRLFQRLADQNVPGGLWALGAMYGEGKGVPQNYVTAAKWYRRAADRGHPLGQYELGALYDKGLGVSQNLPEAAKWYRRASEQGYGMAQFNLGSMYATGEGVTLDRAEAYKWFSIAARGGGYLDQEPVKNEAARARSALGSQISPVERADGQARADGWKPSPEPQGVAAVQELLKNGQVGKADQNVPAKGTPAEVAASFALGTCYDALDDISRVKSYARLMKWRELPPDVKNVMRPVASGSNYQAWTVNEGGQTFIVSAHVGSFRGKPAQVCQVFISVPAEQVIASIGNKVRLSSPQSADMGMQRNEVYQFLQHPTGRPALLLVAKSKEGEKGAVLGFMGVQQ